MKTLNYSITINKPVDFVFSKITDKSVYADWAKAWGEGMTYEGEWKQGGNISFYDKQGGTKVIVEELKPNEYIKTRHIAMVNPKLEEVELTDDTMKKWIGSREDYFFRANNDETTTLQIVMLTDEAFEEMMKAWPKALEYLKDICEK